MEIQDEAAQREDVQRRLKLASILCFTFLAVEVVGGLISGSLAVLSDAAHLSSDLMSFLFALAAGRLASMPGSKDYTYGYGRWEVLAALFSMSSLAICSAFIWVEGVRRLLPFLTGTSVIEGVDGGVMSMIAAIGVVVNIALALVLGVENHVHMPGGDHGHSHDHTHGNEEEVNDQCTLVTKADGSGKNNLNIEFGDSKWHFGHGHDHSHSHGHGNVCSVVDRQDISKESTIAQAVSKRTENTNLNLRAAYLHVLSDLVQSVAVLTAGVVIWYKPEWRIIDPILSIIFCPLIIYSSLGVIRSSVHILVEGTPPEVNLEEIQSSITSVDGVTNVCDLHVWSISHSAVAMTVHARATDPKFALRMIHKICTKRYGIGHCTIQVEEDNCNVCGPGMVHCYDPNKRGSSGGEYELVECHDAEEKKDDEANRGKEEP